LNKLHIVFFNRFLALFVTLFAVIGAISYIWFKNLYIAEIKKDLLNNIKISQIALENGNFDTLAKRIKQQTNYRVTIINKDGKVIAESNKEKSLLNNHKNRPEVAKALQNGVGSSIRVSATLNEKLLYVAKKCTIKSKTFVIRMAANLRQVNLYFLNLAIKILAILGLFLGVGMYFANRLGKEIESETTKILYALKSLAKQKKATEISSNYSIEFNKITRLVSKVSKIISKRQKQKAKYTAKLKFANRQKDEIISAIGHEFKNPIAAISGYAQTLSEQKDINSELRDKFLYKIYKNSNRLAKLIDRLRLLHKLEGNNHKLSFKTFDVTTLAKRVAVNLQESFANREVTVVQNATLEIKADKMLFEIALRNLVENGLKYSNDEVVITIDKKSIKVTDKGIGISQKDISKIEQKFYRASSNNWDNSLGIGLSIVKQILNLHNFKLQITSQPNKGSVFEIIIKD